jgi:single-strand DNA-binding protein
MNTCTFFGRLGADPEIKNLPNGSTVARFTLAVSQMYTDKSGEKKEGTQWVTCIAWDKQAEFAQKHLGKGQRVLITARYESRSYEVQGEKRWAHEFRVSQIDVVDWPEKMEAKPVPTPPDSALTPPAPKAATTVTKHAAPSIAESDELPF